MKSSYPGVRFFAVGVTMLLGTKNLVAHADGSAPATVKLKIDQSELTLELPTAQPAAWRQDVVEHLQMAAIAVSHYYGQFPVPNATIRVSAVDGDHVNGREWDGRTISYEVGKDISHVNLVDDWVATHEMFHLSFPSMGDDHNWMNEGLSDYLEPIARAAAGQISDEEAWQGFVEGMPKGQPHTGDKGLDHTHTWGRTYWGGCIYWLLVDVQIRQQTNGAKSVADSLKAILAAGGDGGADWDLEKVFKIGDAATGTHVLREVHDELGDKPKTVDLDALWKSLGVKFASGKITFDDTAPLAGIRKAITAKQ